MKKIFVNPTAEIISVEMEDNILGASAIVEGGSAQHTEGGVSGGNGGDANARQNSVVANPSKPSISAYELN